jgi:uncharacterized protein
LIRRLLRAVAAPVVGVTAPGPVVDRMARRLADAPRRLPNEGELRPAVEALGGEIVRFRARDGVRLAGRWLPAEGTDDDAWVPDPREAVLLLHGYSGSIAPDLVEYGPFLRRTAGVLGLDFRGHGDSDDGPTTFGYLEVEDVAGALAWLGERGIRRVALFGTSMGGITALGATVVLGDGRLAAADADPTAPAGVNEAPRPRIVGIVADSVTPELALVVANRAGLRFGRRLAERAFARLARSVGGDPRDTQPIRAVALLEDVPLLLVHGEADTLVPVRDARRLAEAAPAGTAHLVVPGAGHGEAHATDPARYEAAVSAHLRSAFEGARS